MHERERHKLILSAVQERPVATIGEVLAPSGAQLYVSRRSHE